MIKITIKILKTLYPEFIPFARLSALCLILILDFSFLIETNATIRYVSHTGTSTPPFTTWETAADSIQKCINISGFGDTIYVANGVYKEQVVMIPGLALIGAGMDSCVIDTRELVTSVGFIAVTVADSCLLEGFEIIVYYNSEKGYGISVGGNNQSKVTVNKVTKCGVGVYAGYSGFGVVVYKNLFEYVSVGALLRHSNAIIRRNLIYRDPNTQTSLGVIDIEAFDNKLFTNY